MSFQCPWHFDFPPFFTIQPNLTTRDKQLKAWARLVLDYCQHNKIYSLDLEEAANSDLFNNRRLNRRLDDSAIRSVFDHLEQQKHVEWRDKAKTRCNIYWRRPEEWGQLLYEWASSIGLVNTPVTLYELTKGEDAVQESFYGLDKEVLLKGLQHLEDQGRAVLIDIDGEKGGSKQTMVLETGGVTQRVGSDHRICLGSTFVRYADRIEEGDTVIVYVNAATQYHILVRRGHTLHMKYGALRHEFLIGKRYGTPISATAGYVYVLRANPNLWTRTLQKQTQILYTPDIATILLLLDVRPGSRICETGTGSGSLSHALTTALSPNGHLYSYDIDSNRVKIVQEHMKQHDLVAVTSVELRNVCEEGFSADDCDGVFLDLPAPWLAIGHAKKALCPAKGGRLVSFSPCIEQVQRVCEELESHGFVQIETIEVVPQRMKVIDMVSESMWDSASAGANPPEAFQRGKKRLAEETEEPQPPDLEEAAKRPPLLEAVPFPAQQPTHTGYLTHATLLPQFCQTATQQNDGQNSSSI